jgi:RND family efflux transporter MFP subunit
MKASYKTTLALFLGIAAGVAGAWLYAQTDDAKQKEEFFASAAPAGPAAVERKVLFYRHPMKPAVTSSVPKKDEMGMDYTPVYGDEAASAQAAPGTVRISPERIQKIGVKTEEVKRRDLKRVIRTVGRVEPIENRVFLINAKISGWVEKLYVDRTDQMVRKNAPLLELYSPDLVAAEEGYLIAWKAFERAKESPYEEVRAGAQRLVEASRQRLKYWDISDDQIERLKKTGQITRTMTIRASSSGSVTEKMVVEGQKIEAGEPLFKIIDHSAVWVYGEIYEYEMPYIRLGQTASLYPAYSTAEVYRGKIEHIYSHLGSIRYSPEEGTEVRTAKVRFELPNSAHNLKLGMYLNVEISASVAKNAVTAPDSAVMDSGERQMVIVDIGNGTFEPREVKVGAMAEGYYQILEGVSEGESVVTSANFLIDSESNLRAALSALSSHGHRSEKTNSAPKTEAPAAPAAPSMPAASATPAAPADHGASDGHGGHGGH